jgi:hypothetical protein
MIRSGFLKRASSSGAGIEEVADLKYPLLLFLSYPLFVSFNSHKDPVMIAVEYLLV